MTPSLPSLARAARRRLGRVLRRGLAAPATHPASAPEAAAAAREHLARANAHKSRGDDAAAEAAYRAAFERDPYLVEAHDGLARLRLPGPDYLAWLAHVHAIQRPRVYLEIGVATGRTLSLAQPPTRAIGIDPQPMIDCAFTAETQLYRETSDAFFGTNRLTQLLGGEPVALGFIDGLHLFEQALRDFINLEAHCAPTSIILLHDTIPLDERTQNRVATTGFYTGDVWKIVPCLKHYRPDLRVVTIAAAPTGLTAITRLDPGSRVLAERYDEAVARFIGTLYSEVAENRASILGIVPNAWDALQV